MKLLARIEATGGALERRFRLQLQRAKKQSSLREGLGNLIIPSDEEQAIHSQFRPRLESLKRRRRKIERMLRVETQAQHAKRHVGMPRGRERVLRALRERGFDPHQRNVAGRLAGMLKLSKRTVQEHLQKIREELDR